jgi:peptide/nickel transport system substrate-binding protein
MGPDYALYYSSGGTQGTKPDDQNILKIWELFSEASSLKTDGRNKNAQEIWKILVEQQYGIGTVGQSPAGLGVRLVSNKLGNIAAQVCNAQHCRTPGNSHPETWYFKT